TARGGRAARAVLRRGALRPRGRVRTGGVRRSALHERFCGGVDGGRGRWDGRGRECGRSGLRAATTADIAGRSGRRGAEAARGRGAEAARTGGRGWRAARTGEGTP